MILSVITHPILLPALIGAGIALLAGTVIMLAFRFFSVESNPLQQSLEEVLPGVNCGGCGYSGCAAYAAALADGSEALTTLCTAGGQDTATAVAQVMGVEAGRVIPMVANVFCQGTCDNTSQRYEYTGTPTVTRPPAFFRSQFLYLWLSGLWRLCGRLRV